jgi:hypothetical protein
MTLAKALGMYPYYYYSGLSYGTGTAIFSPPNACPK